MNLAKQGYSAYQSSQASQGQGGNNRQLNLLLDRKSLQTNLVTIAFHKPITGIPAVISTIILNNLSKELATAAVAVTEVPKVLKAKAATIVG
jgi:hypothetical protein